MNVARAQTGGLASDPVRPEELDLAPGPLRGLAGAALLVAGGALVALAGVEVWQVFARYVLDAPAAWTEPVGLLFLKVALMLAAAVAVRHETHFRFALGAEAMSPRWRAALEAFARLASAGIGVAFVVWGAQLMLATWTVKAPGAALSSGLYYAPFVGGGVLFVLFAAERLVGAGERP